MKKFIFLAGAPGSGKSTVAAALQQRLDSPMFEFGWIPEFRNTGTKTITYTEDEALAFENLTLVLKNYARHGFEGIIVTGLENKRIEQVGDIFKDFEYVIITLRILDETVLKNHVLDPSRSSEYRDWTASLDINRKLFERSEFKNEHFIDVSDQSVESLTQAIASMI